MSSLFCRRALTAHRRQGRHRARTQTRCIVALGYTETLSAKQKNLVRQVGRKLFPLGVARNPLKSLELDEEIQGNPRKSKRIQAAFLGFVAVRLGNIWFGLGKIWSCSASPSGKCEQLSARSKPASVGHRSRRLLMAVVHLAMRRPAAISCASRFTLSRKREFIRSLARCENQRRDPDRRRQGGRGEDGDLRGLEIRFA